MVVFVDTIDDLINEVEDLIENHDRRLTMFKSLFKSLIAGVIGIPAQY